MSSFAVTLVDNDVHITSDESTFIMYDLNQLMLVDPGLQKFFAGSPMMLDLSECNESTIELVKNRIKINITTAEMRSSYPVTVEHSLTTFIDFPDECVQSLRSIADRYSPTEVALIDNKIVVTSNDKYITLTHDAKSWCADPAFRCILGGYPIAVGNIYIIQESAPCYMCEINNTYIELCHIRTRNIIHVNFSRHNRQTLRDIGERVRG